MTGGDGGVEEGDAVRQRTQGQHDVGSIAPPTGSTEGGDPTPWMRDPPWMVISCPGTRATASVEERTGDGEPRAGAGRDQPMEDDREDGRAEGTINSSHVLTRCGPLLWCNRCAAYALERVGARLARTCEPSTSRATALRLRRMRQGLHPITGGPIG